MYPLPPPPTPNQTCKTWHLSVCLKGQSHCAGTSCSPITPFIKTSRGIYNKGVGAILSHPSIYSLSLTAPMVAAGVMDDITQQGFGRRYYHGTGISMEPPCLLSRAIDRGLLHDPPLLKGPSERRSYSLIQAPGINSDRGPRPKSSRFLSCCRRLSFFFPTFLLRHKALAKSPGPIIEPKLADLGADSRSIHSGA